MFGSSFMSALPSTGSSPASAPSSSAGGGGNDINNNNNNNATTTPLPFAGFGFTGGGANTTASSSKSAVKALSFTSGLSNAAVSSSASVGKTTTTGNNTSGGFSFGSGGASGGFAFGSTNDTAAAAAVPFFTTGAAKDEPAKKTLFSSTTTATTAATTTSTTDIVPINDNTSPPYNNNNNMSLENTCLSPDGRSFHTYMYDVTIGKHVIVSEFAPFISSNMTSSWENNDDNNNNASPTKVQIKTILPTTVSEAISIDPVLGLICVEGDNGNNSNNNSGGGAKKSGRRMKNYNGQGKELMTLPWMCLYTCSSAFLLSIGYVDNEEEEDDATNNSDVVIDGEIIRIMEPFEKELLMSSRGSAILRIRSAPSSSGMFHRCGSMALLMREGGEEDSIGHVMLEVGVGQ
jgi:hypothetical protein